MAEADKLAEVNSNATMPSSETTRRRWLAYLLTTEPADRPRAEKAIHDLYVAAEVDAPRHFCWLDSPAAACWAVAVLIESRQPHWADILAAARRSAGDRELVERARAALCACCGQPAWETVVATIRLCFHWGGFPGYDGMEHGIPPEIATLRSGLIAF